MTGATSAGTGFFLYQPTANPRARLWRGGERAGAFGWQVRLGAAFGCRLFLESIVRRRSGQLFPVGQVLAHARRSAAVQGSQRAPGPVA
jgi:hypothetical protein